jgi:hypothetical protein
LIVERDESNTDKINTTIINQIIWHWCGLLVQDNRFALKKEESGGIDLSSLEGVGRPQRKN